jgi:hypothetical protein
MTKTKLSREELLRAEVTILTETLAARDETITNLILDFARWKKMVSEIKVATLTGGRVLLGTGDDENPSWAIFDGDTVKKFGSALKASESTRP